TRRSSDLVDVGLRRRQVVDQLARILFQVQALDADVEEAAVLGLHLDHALAHDGVIQLADLIAGRQVGIEVVLAVELALQIDLGAQAQTRLHRLLNAVLVQGRKHTGEAGVDQRHLLVRPGAEADRCAREQLGVRGHLGVDLQTHDDFPSARAALDQFGVLSHAHHQRSGLATKPAASSRAPATWKTVASSRALPMTCRPSGRPSLFSPAGTEMPGRPARLVVTVKTSFRYMVRGSICLSPIAKAADGVDGVRMASTLPQTLSKSSAMRRRTFSALT